MKGDRIPAKVLAARRVDHVTPALAGALGLSQHQRSIGILTADSDDCLYLALDEATKAAAVEVVYAKSFYAGAANASTRLAGEVIGILAGPSPSEVESGLRAARHFLEHGTGFLAADDEASVVYLAHTHARTGTYLSQLAEVPEGSPLAYLIAPPAEAVVGLDAAMKAADVELALFFPPPSETNFAGGLLTGTESACRAAAAAFAHAVEAVAADPQGGLTWN